MSGPLRGGGFFLTHTTSFAMKAVNTHHTAEYCTDTLFLPVYYAFITRLLCRLQKDAGGVKGR